MDRVENSPVPEDWQSLPKVTVIDAVERHVNLGLLEKTGRQYIHFRPVWEGKPHPHVIHFPKDAVTVLEGHDTKVQKRYLKWRRDEQAHGSERSQAHWRIESEVRTEMGQEINKRLKQWDEEHPMPPLPRFFPRKPVGG